MSRKYNSEGKKRIVNDFQQAQTKEKVERTIEMFEEVFNRIFKKIETIEKGKPNNDIHNR